MFTSLHTDTSPKQYGTFAAILLLQLAALGLFRLAGALPGYRAGAIRRAAPQRNAVAELYFRPPHSSPPKAEAVVRARPAASPAPPATPAIRTPQETPTASSPQSPPQAESAGSAGEAVPFSPVASWVLEEIPNDPLLQHTGYEQAMPDFTPEPPILHRFYPDAARGQDLVVDLLINEQGVLVGASVVQGIGHGVEEVLMETLRGWTFFPARMQGVAVPSRRRVRFHFPS